MRKFVHMNVVKFADSERKCQELLDKGYVEVIDGKEKPAQEDPTVTALKVKLEAAEAAQKVAEDKQKQAETKQKAAEEKLKAAAKKDNKKAATKVEVTTDPIPEGTPAGGTDGSDTENSK